MALGEAARKRLATAAPMALATLWLFVFLVLPFAALLVFAFGERVPAISRPSPSRSSPILPLAPSPSGTR